jgi:hydrogenase maturation protein HypF
MAENNLDGEVIGVAFDGTGFGLDGNIWGGEFFAGGYKSFKRAGYFEYVRMPGGEMAVKEPWRMALSYLLGIYGDIYGTIDYKGGINIDGVRLFEGVKPENIRTVAQITQKGLNSPLTSSAGRMFDAVSALLGFEGRIDFEGQAAIELEYLADDLHQGGYSYLIDESEGVLKVNISPGIKEIIKDLSYKVNKSIIASRFHETIACVVLECCMRIRGGTGLNRVVLSGGVFQNMKLLESCVLKLRKHGFSVYTHSTIPANDGGVALGQAVIAALNHL